MEMVQDIKDKLKRKATIFETGGQKPTNELLESWIGSVCWQESKEEIYVFYIMGAVVNMDIYKNIYR